MSSNSKKTKKKGFQNLGTLFDQFQPKEDKGYITQEFQDFGYRLAVELDDLKHKSLYIKLAKEEERALLERVLSFVADAQADNKGALFMWKLKQLKTERAQAQEKSIQETKKPTQEAKRPIKSDPANRET